MKIISITRDGVLVDLSLSELNYVSSKQYNNENVLVGEEVQLNENVVNAMKVSGIFNRFTQVKNNISNLLITLENIEKSLTE